ncbi:hypothetical protein AMATHDRAFT_99685, partial [Amanita thiersii Skay4041]
AEKPFDLTALADVIIRSSDNIDFHVLQALLRLVSPIFRDMFSLSSGLDNQDDHIKNGLPIIDLPEDSESLHFLLTIIYPHIDEPKLDDCHLIWKVCKAAQKYCMDIIEGKLRKLVLASDRMNAEAFRMYAIAVELGWMDVVTIAAQNTL